MAERKHILLAAINAKYIHSNLAVYSLKAYAEKYQDRIGLAEYTINQNLDDILKGIYRDHPEVLCISCYIWNISYVKNLIREVHKVLPDTAIWLGGPEVSYDARKEAPCALPGSDSSHRKYSRYNRKCTEPPDDRDKSPLKYHPDSD